MALVNSVRTALAISFAAIILGQSKWIVLM